MSDKLVISAALAGAATMKEHNAALPYTPEEFAQESRRCMDEGASIVHIHVRDPQTGHPTSDLGLMGATVGAIRDACPGLLVNLSTAISPESTIEQRIAPVPVLKPDLASLNTNSMNAALANRKTGEILAEYVFTNTFAQLEHFATVMRDNLVRPELEIYDFGGLYNVLLFRKREIIPEPLHFQMVFGLVGGVPFDPFNFARMRELMPQGGTWSVCGVGPMQVQAGMCSAVNGGHIRVGLEDNTRMPDGTPAQGSWEQVRWAAQVAALAGRTVATPSEAREIFNLPARA
ncbi:MAG: 3-keto-5-aminohexanoate cleavage protein [Dermatophilaceae bacterium]